jgi:hypothetical protein
MIRISKEFQGYNRNLGNKLFTYAFSRIIAETLGYKMEVPKNSLIQRKNDVINFPFGGINGIEIKNNEICINDGFSLSNDIQEIIEKCKNKRVNIGGYHLRYELIKNHKDQIKKWYGSLISEQDGKNDVLIMLRDSRIDPTFKLPDDYYEDILRNLEFDNLYVSYDHKERHETLLNKISKYNPILIDLPILELFKFNTSKKTIIAAQGTFSFWVCLLSNSEKIYWPITNIGPNRLDDVYVKLKVDDEERYKHINVNIKNE